MYWGALVSITLTPIPSSQAENICLHHMSHSWCEVSYKKVLRWGVFTVIY